jgi:hypothetical protein
VVSGWPQASQNRLPGTLLWPHEAHVAARAAPQLLQNLAPVRFSAPHAEHPIAHVPGSSIASTAEPV